MTGEYEESRTLKFLVDYTCANDKFFDFSPIELSFILEATAKS